MMNELWRYLWMNVDYVSILLRPIISNMIWTLLIILPEFRCYLADDDHTPVWIYCQILQLQSMPQNPNLTGSCTFYGRYSIIPGLFRPETQTHTIVASESIGDESEGLELPSQYLRWSTSSAVKPINFELVFNYSLGQKKIHLKVVNHWS